MLGLQLRNFALDLGALLDVAGRVNRRRLHHAVDSAFRLQLVTWQMLCSVLVRHSARGRDGCGPLRLLLEER